MSDITRGEMDAKLEAAEARVEAKLVGIDGKIDRLSDGMNAKLDRLSDQVSSAIGQVSMELKVTREAAERGEAAANEARKAASQMKWNILFTAIGATTVLLAAWAIWMQGMEMIGTLLSAKPPGS